MKPLLHTAGVSLRAVEPEDLELMYRIENDTDLWPQGNTSAPYSRYALRRYIEQAQCDAYADGEVRMVVTTARGEDIGFADLYRIDHRHHRAEVGLAILPQWRGQGYARQALRLLCRYAGYLQLHQLYAVISTRNHAANSLFQGTPFRPSAILPHWLREDDGTYASATLHTLVLPDTPDSDWGE